MLEIQNATGAVVAADTQASVAALDSAVLTQARLCASVVEGAAQSMLPISATQKLLQAMTDGMSGLVASRMEMVAVVRELTSIQKNSNLNVTSFGCPNDFAGPHGADKNDSIRAKLLQA